MKKENCRETCESREQSIEMISEVITESVTTVQKQTVVTRDNNILVVAVKLKLFMRGEATQPLSSI